MELDYADDRKRLLAKLMGSPIKVIRQVIISWLHTTEKAEGGDPEEQRIDTWND